MDVSVLACSKGAEVYSIVRTIRSARADLKLRMHAVDISQEVLEFAQAGIYSLDSPGTLQGLDYERIGEKSPVTWNPCRDQELSILERLTREELESIFELEGNQARVRPWLKDGITWLRADASDPALIGSLGLQDMVVANRFLCHMEPAAAERCLRTVMQLVKPGGYLFVSGIDLDVRTKVAREMGWKPVTDLIREIHEGDSSLRRGWPLEYWGLEPFCADRPDCAVRYASVFQIGDPARSGVVESRPRRTPSLLDLGQPLGM
jgi:hypothetical protein